MFSVLSSECINQRLHDARVVAASELLTATLLSSDPGFNLNLKALSQHLLSLAGITFDTAMLASPQSLYISVFNLDEQSSQRTSGSFYYSK